MKIKQLIIPIMLLAPVAHAQTYNFDIAASNTGWINQNGFGDNSNSNYMAGTFNFLRHRNYFSFDLTNVLGSITDASITITMPSGGMIQSSNSEYFALSTVDSYIGTNDVISGNTALFDDLGDGSFVGSELINYSNNSQTITIDLDQDFLTQANNSSAVTLGGSVVTLNGSINDEYVFAGSEEFDENGLPNVTLNLTVDPNGAAVPEPSSTLLVGLAGLGFILRRRR